MRPLCADADPGDGEVVLVVPAALWGGEGQAAGRCEEQESKLWPGPRSWAIC